MNYKRLIHLLNSFNGCTIATIDTETKPSVGIRKLVEGEQVLLFSNIDHSGYEACVHNKLKALGYDNPETLFVVGDLPWGTRLNDLPIIAHKGRLYLQTISFKPGKVRAFVGVTEVDPEMVLKGRDRNAFNWNQGLPAEHQVKMKTYALENIKKIKLLKEEVT